MLDAAGASDVLGGAGRMPGRECGRQCSSTAGLDADLLMRRGAVSRVEAAARATASRSCLMHDQQHESSPFARQNGRSKLLQASSSCTPAFVCAALLRGTR